jgi:serine/threonine protein kinase
LGAQTRGAQASQAPHAPFDRSRLAKSTSKAARRAFEVLEPLGVEGKDGQVFLVRRRVDAECFAMKVFKPTKSVANIRRECAFQRRAAAAGLAPKIVSEWEADESNRCFVMERMERTLEDLLRDQKGTLTKAQAGQIEALVRGLSRIKIMHNDGNIGKNLMERADGTLLLIDFGMSKPIDSRVVKKFGKEPNLGLLGQVDRMLKRPMFKATIAEYEAGAGVVVDARAAARAKMEARKLQRLREMGLMR